MIWLELSVPAVDVGIHALADDALSGRGIVASSLETGTAPSWVRLSRLATTLSAERHLAAQQFVKINPSVNMSDR